MKTVFKILLVIIAFCMLARYGESLKAQTMERVINIDNQTAAKKQTTEASIIGKSIPVQGLVAVYKGEKKQVYKTSTGKHFIAILSRNGNWYKKYITVE